MRYFDEPLAPIQLMAYVQQAAAKGQWLDWYARDALARARREHLPDGWQFRGRVRGVMDYPTARALFGLERHHGHPGECLSAAG